MENKKPLILVSNDDGVMAKGINELVRFLRPLGDIVVMAPDKVTKRSRTSKPSFLQMKKYLPSLFLPVYKS